MPDFARQDAIHQKGFDLFKRFERPAAEPTEYNSIKTGTKTLDDAILNLGSIPKIRKNFGNKNFILKAIAEHNLPLMREISNYFYETSGIYSRVCDYYAYLYRFDWYVVPEILSEESNEKLNTKIKGDFNKISTFLDNSNIKKVCGDISLEVIKNGVYYGYIVPSSKGLVLQQLPANYCRAIYNSGSSPAIEFDMRFFDDCFRDVTYRMQILKLFPKEFQKGYALYKQGKIEPDRNHLERYLDPYGTKTARIRSGCWYLLDPGSTVKFSLANNDQPIFINAIPAILDLDAAQDLDRRKQMQQLMKIVIQELPLDKNGDLVFDLDEAADIHNNAVEMLEHAIGVDVLTTFADIKVEDVADSNTTTTTDDLEKMERAVYNAFGTSRNLFNTDSNLSLEKSILDDESTMRPLLLQLTAFYDRVTQLLSTNKKKYNFRFYMLETTQYNYKDISKMYKEQVQMGYSKILPEVALGHSQSSILHMAHFENEILKLSEVMIPPLMSSTMNADSLLGNKNQTNNNNSQNNSSGSTTTTQTTSTSTNSAGRPEKSDSEKSEKTIANKESM